MLRNRSLILIALVAIGPLGCLWQSSYGFLSIRDKIKARYYANLHNDHKTDSAQVRPAEGLCQQELDYCKNREEYIQKKLEKRLDRSLKNQHIPKIALLCSGGGYRSMLMDTGALVQLQELGILDFITYISTLSGSSWAVSCWMSSGLPIKEFEEQLIIKSGKGLARISPHDGKLISSFLIKKWVYNQPITIVDWYGALLANVLLAEQKDKKHAIYLSDQAQKIISGEYPLPLYALGIYDQQGAQEWLEVTPFECGCTWLGGFIPTWSLGRQFLNGSSIDHAPEQGLGFYLGAFGSGFAATTARIYKEAKERFTNSSFLNSIICKKVINQIGARRISSADVYNFTVGLPSSPLKDSRLIHLADAGLDFNIAYPPVGERDVDIIIVFDTSRTIAAGHHLRKMEQYAKEHNFKLPVINYTDIDKHDVSVFKDDNDPTVPIIVYIPRTIDEERWNTLKNLPEYKHYQEYLNDTDANESVDDSFARTTNFKYTPAQARYMCTVGKYKMQSAEQEIMNAIESRL